MEELFKKQVCKNCQKEFYVSQGNSQSHFCPTCKRDFKMSSQTSDTITKQKSEKGPWINAARLFHNPKSPSSFRAASSKKGGEIVLFSIIAILFVLWLLGFSLDVGGGLVHLLLVIAVIVLIVRLVTGGRAP